MCQHSWKLNNKRVKLNKAIYFFYRCVIWMIFFHSFKGPEPLPSTSLTELGPVWRKNHWVYIFSPENHARITQILILFFDKSFHRKYSHNSRWRSSKQNHVTSRSVAIVRSQVLWLTWMSDRNNQDDRNAGTIKGFDGCMYLLTWSILYIVYSWCLIYTNAFEWF